MIHFEISSRMAHEQRRDKLAQAEQHRQLAACNTQIALTRRAARPLGRALMSIGATLLRYGRVESPEATRPYQASASSIQWN